MYDLQTMIDNGTVWRLEGSAGRAAMDAIRNGDAVLGTHPHRDYWGNRVPSRMDVKPGTVGSVEYAKARMDERINEGDPIDEDFYAYVTEECEREAIARSLCPDELAA